MTMKGASRTPPTSTEKIVTAASSPFTRLNRSGPIPWPSKCWSVAGVVMLSHSPMFRMNRTLPDAVDGLNVPNTASCRASQGATTRTNSPAQATAAQTGIAGRRAPPLRRQSQAGQRAGPRGDRGAIAPVYHSAPSPEADDCWPWLAARSWRNSREADLYVYASACFS